MSPLTPNSSNQLGMIRISLEGALDPWADPAAIKFAGLSQNVLSFQPAAIHAAGINTDPAGQEREGLCWLGVTPACPNSAVGSISSTHIPIRSHSFPFTKRGPSR